MDPILIIGGGLAGLACALRLQEAGRRSQILEASDAVGGRVRTDALDGFLLDRGFQVFLDAYPQAGALLDLPALDLRPFKPGALVHLDDRFHRVMDVFREPRHLIGSALAPIGTLGDKLRVAALKWRLGRSSSPAQHTDLSTADYLAQAGFSPRMIDVFFRSFYGGIFLERDLRTSSRMFEFTFRMFSRGSATLPARGMGEIPRQLAAKLPAESIRCGTRVVEAHPRGVTLASGERLAGDAVVIATDANTAALLLPASDSSPLSWRGVTGIHFAADRSPLREAIIALDGSGRGLVNNLCVPSDVAPNYAPPGQSLIFATVLGTADEQNLETRVRGELATWFGPEVHSWRHLRTDRIPYALPEQAPSNIPAPGFRERDGILVCGDHLATASIEGAIHSGLRAADHLLGR
ncbi:MAG: FAD-dependent oxidoreductase [Verrucomicrobia bacterium]|nr:MAG: FAD-dependent oxidoreductase [Verrucomicrobiota bacterium]TAE87646.1 MAG: FAD-dependent oxidoreductase [Verrucomicrobiota bacterium]TAF25419.1 MAG: FAD-dependent oxidoreductase [Verrucomicrobiota bacterium]TAF41206.1 MAG: FAD-dependent oxidoreductase [Verrucomicrobiota bacterium]